MRCPRVIWAGLTCCLLAAPVPARDVPRSMLVLDESAGAAAGPFYAGIVTALRASVNRDAASQASVFVEHLDLSRFRGSDYEAGLKVYLRSKYGENPVGVIVAVGDGALRYVLRSRAELWPNVPVVFTFVDPSSASTLNL